MELKEKEGKRKKKKKAKEKKRMMINHQGENLEQKSSKGRIIENAQQVKKGDKTKINHSN